MARRISLRWRTGTLTKWVALGVAAGVSGTPIWAQERPGSILERMQDEVATVARQSRAAIVTIEDSRALTANYANSALRKTDLEDQIARLLIEKKAADAEVTQRQTQFNAGAATLQDLAKPRAEQARLEARLAFLRQRLANAGREDPLTEQIAELQMESSVLQVELNNSREELRVEQGRFTAGLSSRDKITALQRQIADAQLRTVQANAELAQANAQAAARQNSAFVTLITAAVLQPTPPRSGSGFSIGDGYIVTTADVAQGMTNPVVTTDDGRQARATLVAVDTRLNIALLRLSANLNLPALKLGDSAAVAPGHFAITMGNQVGQTNSVALSTISALRTQGLASAAHYYPELLQIDGTVSAGTSGAPVLNARGEVIGMLAATPTADVPPSKGFTPGLSATYRLMPDQSVPLKNTLMPHKLLHMETHFLPVTPGAATLPNPFLAPPKQTTPGTRKTQMTAPAPPLFGQAAPSAPFNLAGPAFESKQADSISPLFTDTSHQNIMTYVIPVPLTYYFYDPKTGVVRTMTEAEAAQLKSMPSMFYNNQTRTWTDKDGKVLSALEAVKILDTTQSSVDAFTFPAPAPAPPASTSSGFAIPVNAMKSVLDKLKAGKNVAHAWLGLSLEDIDHARADNGIVRLDKQVKITGIYDRSPASKAGLTQLGDILVGLNDLPVQTSNDVRSAILLRFKPEQKIMVHLLRGGKPLDVPLTLEAVPAVVPPLLTVPVSPATVK